MRKGASLYYFANDQVGSTSLVMDSAGQMVSQTRYYPYGNVWTQGVSATPQTDKLFTGQRRYGANSGIYFYGSRFYSADIGRFLQADTIVPGAANPQALNRYSYVLNNPLTHYDPTGHCAPGINGCPDRESGYYPTSGGGGPSSPAGVPDPIDQAFAIVGQEERPDIFTTIATCGGISCNNRIQHRFTSRTGWAAEVLSQAGYDLNSLGWTYGQRSEVKDWLLLHGGDPDTIYIGRKYSSDLSLVMAFIAALQMGGGGGGGKLKPQIPKADASSVFTSSGELQPPAIQSARQIIPGGKLRNPTVINALTSDGSKIDDWGKYSTVTYDSPSGPFQVHFYYNSGTGTVNYQWDYKVFFTGPR